MQKLVFALLLAGLALPVMSFAQAAPPEVCGLICAVEGAVGQDLGDLRDALACDCNCTGGNLCPAPEPPAELPL